MNFATFERGQVAMFAFREAQHTGSLDCVKAVCLIVRNRVRSGWGDGTWWSVLQSAKEVAAHPAYDLPATGSDNRLLQMTVRDIDDLYLGMEGESNVTRVVAGDGGSGNKDWKPALFYAFVDKPLSEWFKENIVGKIGHEQCGQIGAMMVYR